jgi:hypothetical protein
MKIMPLDVPLNGYRSCFFGINRSGVEVIHSTSPRTGAKNVWSYTPVSPVYLDGVDRQS